jgi:hypothetical protein
LAVVNKRIRLVAKDDALVKDAAIGEDPALETCFVTLGENIWKE